MIFQKDCQKYNLRQTKIESKNSFYKLQNMHIYCKNCKKHTGNTFPKKLILISKNKIKGKSKCAIYLTERTFINKIEGKWSRK